jgi:hypothetical protein
MDLKKKEKAHTRQTPFLAGEGLPWTYIIERFCFFHRFC